MADLNKAISMTARTGKVVFGFKESVETLRSGKAKLVIAAKNIPSEREKKISSFAEISDVPVITYNGSSSDLGSVCGKPFTVSVIAVREQGDSGILSMVGRQD